MIEVSEAEFRSLTRSVSILLSLVDVEEKFDAIVGNYCDFERYIFDRSLMSILAGYPETIDGQRTRSTTGRKLSNLLTVTKLYQDTVAEHTAQITGDVA